MSRSWAWQFRPILSLHRDKRELVDALLSGADTVGKMSTTQLAELIRAT